MATSNLALVEHAPQTSDEQPPRPNKYKYEEFDWAARRGISECDPPADATRSFVAYLALGCELPGTRPPALRQCRQTG